MYIYMYIYLFIYYLIVYIFGVVRWSGKGLGRNIARMWKDINKAFNRKIWKAGMMCETRCKLEGNIKIYRVFQEE